MSDKDNGGPAYPFEYHNQTSTHQPGFFDTGTLSPGASQQFAGMSLRDYFAAKAMHMFHGTDITCERDIRRRFDFTDAASLAYQYADAMLAERAK